MKQVLKTRIYNIIWLGQTISILGASILSFSFGIWVLKTTNSITHFGFIIFLSTVAESLISPIAGWIADIKSRNSVMLICETIAFFIILLILIFYEVNILSVCVIYISSILIKALAEFTNIAYLALISELLPKNKYEKAVGLVQVSAAFSRIIGPSLGGFLIEYSSLKSALIGNLIGFAFSILTLMFALYKKQQIKICHNTSITHKNTSFKELLVGIIFFKNNHKFKYFLYFFSFLSFFAAAYFILLTPLALAVSNSLTAGLIICSSGIGAISGGAIIRLGLYKKNHVQGIFIATIIMIIALLGTIVFSTKLGIILFSFVFSIGVTLSFGFAQTFYITNIDNSIIGKVLGISRFANSIFLAIAYLISPLMVDKVLPYFYNHPPVSCFISIKIFFSILLFTSIIVCGVFYLNKSKFLI